MEMQQLEDIANRSRNMREVGTMLLLASSVLALFIFIPIRPPASADPAAVVLAPPPSPYANVAVVAKAAIVYDLRDGVTLYEKEADTQLPLASLTKLLTIVAALRTLPLETSVMITAEDSAVESPRRFVVGEELAFSDLARLTLTASLNDGAAAIARTLALREATTTLAALANASAALNLSATYVLNGNGLDVSRTVAGGYGSARDVARVAGALVDLAPSIALATTESSASATTLSGRYYEIRNTNPTVADVPRLLLSKTGFTDLAGGNLALVFDASMRHPIAVVVLGSNEEARFSDAEVLVAATLAHFSGRSTP